jgi:hypothetical protein
VMRAMDGTPFCPTPESFAFNNPSASPTGDISLSHA